VLGPLLPVPFGFDQPHIGATLVQLEPALLDGVAYAGAELWTAGLERVEEGRVDLLDVDAVVDGLSDRYCLLRLFFCGCCTVEFRSALEDASAFSRSPNEPS
jgi:hypothetical protein